MAEISKDGFEQALDATTPWINSLLDFPGFREWKNRSLLATMSYGEPWFKGTSGDFVFPSHIVRQHAVITAYYAMHSTWRALADTEFYFRRFPFNGMPIDMDTHLRYTCENYFARFYEFKERMKACLNAINSVIAPVRLDVGAVMKQYEKIFRTELKQRNLIHHHYRFDEITLDRIGFEGLMAYAKHPAEEWRSLQRTTYRRVSREWAQRAKRRSSDVRSFLSVVGNALVEHCEFLSKPVVVDP